MIRYEMMFFFKWTNDFCVKEELGVYLVLRDRSRINE